LNWLPQNSEKETETPERSVKAKNTKTKKIQTRKIQLIQQDNSKRCIISLSQKCSLMPTVIEFCVKFLS